MARDDKPRKVLGASSDDQQGDITSAEESAELSASQEASDGIPRVTVTVPKPYILRLDDHSAIEIKAGVQEMREDWATHWYSVANGVVIYQPS